MFEEWRRQRAANRVKPGDGRALRRFRWWQSFGRALFAIRLPGHDGRASVYTVDVRHWGNKGSGTVTADLYLDGRRHAVSKLPAAFPVPGGTIEVALSNFGVKRCRFAADGGGRHRLVPDPASPEGRRARVERDHPVLDRWIGVVSVLLLLVGVGLNLSQLIGPITRIPPIAEAVGSHDSPLRLPLWLTLASGIGAVLGSVERALRLRYRWYLDALGN